MNKKIYFATDHAGFELKNIILAFVRDELRHDVVDCGATILDTADDYPDFVHQAVKAVGEDSVNSLAIVFGHSGQGEAKVANRYQGVRAVVYYGHELEVINLAREHNDSNVLSLGAHFVSTDEAKKAVALWLSTAFSGDERHVRRISKIDLSN